MDNSIMCGKVVYWIDCFRYRINIGVVNYIDEFGYNVSMLKNYEELFIDGVPIEDFKDEYTKRPKNARLFIENQEEGTVSKHHFEVKTPYYDIIDNIDYRNIDDAQDSYNKGYIVKNIFKYKVSEDWKRDTWKTIVEKNFLNGFCIDEKYVFTSWDDAVIYRDLLIKERDRFMSLPEEDRCKEENLKYLKNNGFSDSDMDSIMTKIDSLGNVDNLEIKIERYGNNLEFKRVLYKYFESAGGIKPLVKSEKWCGSMKRHRKNVKIKNAESAAREKAKWKVLFDGGCSFEY